MCICMLFADFFKLLKYGVLSQVPCDVQVLHLRRQLLLLKRCKDNQLDEELGEPS